MALQPQRLNIPINGGLSQDETPEYLDPPGLYECINFYHNTRTSLKKRNGLDQYILVADARQAQRTDQAMNVALTGCKLDRFVNTGSSVTFAARGWLWSFLPLAYTQASSLSPIPTTIKHGEIPDLQIGLNTVVGVEDANDLGNVVKDCASAASSGDLQCTTYLVRGPVASSHYEWWAKITSSSTGLVISEKQLLSTANVPIRPCVVAYPGGFVATILDFTTSSIIAWRYTFVDALWANVTWPTLNGDGVIFTGGPYVPLYYDICGTGTNVIHMAFVTASGSWAGAPPPEGGSSDIFNFINGLWACTIDAAALTVTHGCYYMGQHVLRQIGCYSYIPLFAVAGNTLGDTGVIWAEMSGTDAGKIFFRSFHNSTYATSATVLDAMTLGSSNPVPERVGVGAIIPSNSSVVRWNCIWEKGDAGLIAGGGFLSSVHSQTLNISQVAVHAKRVYFATEIGSNPWCQNGNAYALLIPSQPLANTGAFYADQPYVIARTWNDQDWDDSNANNVAYQFPMAVWGYGTTLQTLQPYRFQGGPSTSNLKALASIVLSDPFVQGMGISVQNVTTDPTSADRYDSAPIPGGGAIFGCANPWIFDGETPFEAAFIMRPWAVSVATAVGGSLIDDSTPAGFKHSLIFVYEHEDACGRITRSMPSDIVEFTTDSTYKEVLLQIVPPFWTARRPGTMVIKVYMCRDALSFALAASKKVTTYVSTDTPAYLSFTIAQEPLATAPTLYTNDGTLPSGYGQFASHLIRWNNRIWIGDKNQLSYSHAFIDGDQVSFPEVLTEYLDREITALSPLDDRMLLFSQDAVMYRSGEGPNQNGQSSSYSNWNYLTHEVGCTNSRSVFHSMVGVFFQSRRGIELMDGSGNFIHQRQVETYFGNDSSVLGVLSLPRDHQARILYREHATTAMSMLVMDYSTGSWSKFYGPWTCGSSGYACDTTVVGSTVYMLDALGHLYIENEASQQDGYYTALGVATFKHINWTIITPWIKIDGLQGVQRVWRSVAQIKIHTSTIPVGYSPLFGMDTWVNVDYANLIEAHPWQNPTALEALADTAGNVWLTIGHKYQQCRGYQLKFASTDSQVYSSTAIIWGVTEFVGVWSELGIEPGTGRGKAASKI